MSAVTEAFSIDELNMTPMQLIVYAEYLEGSTLVEACEKAGYSQPAAAASQLRKNEKFQKALQLADNTIRLDLRNLSMVKLRDLLTRSDVADKVALDAAKYAAYISGVEEEMKENSGLNKSAEEMTIDELAQKVLDQVKTIDPAKPSAGRVTNDEKSVAQRVMQKSAIEANPVQESAQDEV